MKRIILLLIVLFPVGILTQQKIDSAKIISLKKIIVSGFKTVNGTG